MSWIAIILPGIRDFTFSTWSPIPDEIYRLIASFSEFQALSINVQDTLPPSLSPSFLQFPSDLCGANFNRLRTLRLGIADADVVLNSFLTLPDWKPQLETFDLRAHDLSEDEE